MAVAHLTSLSAVVGQQIFSHFQSGVDHIHNAIITLQNGKENIYSNIEMASKCFTAAEQILGVDIKTTENSHLVLIQRISHKKSIVRQLKQDETSITVNLSELERSLCGQLQHINDARNDVQRSEDSVREAQTKHKEACKAKKDMDIANAATCWIPFVNLITIPVLTSISLTSLQTAIDDREANLNSARENLSDAQSMLSRLQDSKNRKENELSELRSQKASLEQDLINSEATLQNLTGQRDQKMNILVRMRTCMESVSKVSERGEFLKDESSTRVSKYDVSILYLPFRELMKEIKKMPGYANPNMVLWEGIISSDDFRAIEDPADDWC